ncbi:MAG: nucleotide sugar dehydrogenase [Anaerolineae bacterium]|nr:nucleotide sugar dehydrogenase [Anaerolineae bacterium]
MSVPSVKEALLERIRRKEARVGVVGLGYVGLPLAVEFAEAGFTVLGIDLDPNRVAAINAGQSYIGDVPAERLRPLVEARRLMATSTYDMVPQLDTISICVPTPLGKSRDPDISYILQAADAISQRSRRGQLIILESTTYPGSTEEIIAPRLVANGLRIGEDIFLAFSPERVDPGNPVYTIRNTPKVIGGMTPACLEVASALYGSIIETIVPVSSPAAAEMTKLLENTFRAVNIALVNEIAIMCDRLGLDVWEVIDAAATKPFGFMRFLPGPGLGGHCIPVDPHYLAWKLRTLNYTARFIELAGEINSHMPHYVVDKVIAALNDARKPVRGSAVLILGVAYKKDVSDIRESPALDIMRELILRGANLSYHDPHVPQLQLDDARMQSVELTDQVLQQADCVVIVTDHSAYDWEWVAQNAGLIVDTRNALRGVRAPRAKIVKL